MSSKLPDSPLLDYMRSVFPLGEQAMYYLQSHSFKKTVKRGKFLLKPGEYCNHYYFIHKGILRAFIKEGKKEITTWLNPEKEITTSIRSMVRRQPSVEYIQALEYSELYALHFEHMEEMYRLFPEVNILARKLLVEYYADSEERSYISRIPSAEKRYRHFIRTRPELVNRIPLKYIASYLGITLETLSRLRGKKLF